jgi:hypothetical protein
LDLGERPKKKNEVILFREEEDGEQTKPKTSRKREIIKMRTEMNEIETKKSYKDQ